MTILRIVPVFMAAVLIAGESPAPVTPTPDSTAASKPAKPGKRVSALDLIAEDETWIFRPTVGRPDVFIDMEALVTAQRASKQQQITEARKPVVLGKPGDQPKSGDIDQLVTWAKAEESRVRQAVTARRFDEAMKSADAVLKQLEPHVANADVAPIVVSIRTYRGQAEEAKVRDDAQAAFEAQKIRILGILWSQSGTRLAIIEGETRALSVNDRFKESVVINIDQDRVDFRFNFGRRRFEFPVYVEQLTSRPKP